MNPYAVPLAALEAGVRVPLAEQGTEQAADRTQHLPGNPVLWTAGAAGDAAGAGGGAGGGCGDGGC